MARFYLIRHGDKAAAQLMVGRMPGVHLTAVGRKQARAVARALRSVPIDQLIASPLERAIETAKPLAKAKQLEIETSLAFHEIEMGAWTGWPLTKLTPTRAWKDFCRFPAGSEIPGGETLAEVQSRIVSEIARLRARNPDRRTAIVTHEDPSGSRSVTSSVHR